MIAAARPWLALLLPPLAWIFCEWGLGSALGRSCGAVGHWLGPVGLAAGLLACAGAAAIAWRLARAGAGRSAPPRPWLARVAMFAAGAFALAIGFQLLATLIVPSCAR